MNEGRTTVKTIEVRMEAFGGGKIREVDVKDWDDGASVEAKLERVFFGGQNDFQPKECPSVSVGDVVLLNGDEYRVDTVGFVRIHTGTQYANLY